MENLTKFQKTLVTDLIKEFESLNPVKKVNGNKRFSLETISEVINEKQRVINSMNKHNELMKKVFLEQFDLELNSFLEEFGDLFTIQIGHNNYARPYKTKEVFINETLATSNEMYLFFVSKNRKYDGNDSRYNYCNGMRYIQIYASFRLDRVNHKLETDEQVSLLKIVGLEFRTNDYLVKGSGRIYNTLDELIQNEKEVQRKMVELSR